MHHFNKTISLGIFSLSYLVFTTMPHFWMAAKYIPSDKESFIMVEFMALKVGTHNIPAGGPYYFQ